MWNQWFSHKTGLLCLIIMFSTGIFHPTRLARVSKKKIFYKFGTSRVYLRPCQISTMELFCENS